MLLKLFIKKRGMIQFLPFRHHNLLSYPLSFPSFPPATEGGGCPFSQSALIFPLTRWSLLPKHLAFVVASMIDGARPPLPTPLEL